MRLKTLPPVVLVFLGLSVAAHAEPRFAVSLTSVGAQKIAVIKVVMNARQKGLADAKNFVEGQLPATARSGLTRAEAEAMLGSLLDVGAGGAIAPAGSGPATGVVVAGPATFSVRLDGFGASKIGCIKVVREVTGLGLAETKKLVESAPVVVKAALTRAAADTLAAQLLAAGGTASVVP